VSYLSDDSGNGSRGLCSGLLSGTSMLVILVVVVVADVAAAAAAAVVAAKLETEVDVLASWHFLS